MGHEVPGPGSLTRQTRFSFSDQVTGNPVSSLVPDPPGPRNWLQSAPSMADAVRATPIRKKRRRMGRFLSAGIRLTLLAAHRPSPGRPNIPAAEDRANPAPYSGGASLFDMMAEQGGGFEST